MADISKIKLAGEADARNLKDATARSNMTTLLGGHDLGALGGAAWQNVAETIESATGLATAAMAKNYTDAEIAKIHNFDVIVPGAVAEEIPEGAIYKDGATVVTGTLAASATTMYKLYLVKNSDAGAGAHVEYITVRSGSEGAYTYAWEQIGTTVVDLSNYVQKTRKVGSNTLAADITADMLKTDLGLGALAYKDSASGTVPGQTVTGVKATGNSAGSIDVVLDQTATDATLTKGDFTPAGSIQVGGAAQAAGNKALKGGSISVSIKDAASATAVTDLTFEAYTPAGTIAAKAEGGSFSALKSATFSKDDAGTAIEGTVSAPSITVTPGSEKTFVTGLTGGSVASFDTAKFHGGSAASLSDGFYTAGSDASLSAGAQASLTDQTKAAFAQSGIVAAIDSSDDEMLVFSNAATADAVTDRGTFTANTLQTLSGGKTAVIDTTKFSGGVAASIDDGIFTANVLQGAETSSVHDTPSAALASAPVFTGSKYRVATESDTALKNVEFTGTSADVKLAGAKYLKQEIDAATFSGVEADLSFSGTKVTDALVTGVSYDKASVNAAGTKFNAAALELAVGDIAVASKDVTVE